MPSLICRSEKIFDRVISKVVRNHPNIFMFLSMTVLPLAVLVGVGVITTVIILPISLLFG